MRLPDMQLSYAKCVLCILNGSAAEKRVINLPYYGVSFCEEHITEMANMMKKEGETK